MLIYLLLVGYILILPNIISPFVGGDKAKIRKLTALFGMLAVFLVLALKSPQVGVDIKGYEEQYYISRRVSWGNYDYVYYENGYIFIEKLFSKTGMTFQWFTVIIYFIECFSVFILIRNFSKDARISLLFFVCYQFFVFSTSGLRQTISISLCVFAFLLFSKNKFWFFLAGIALILVATTIHSSAYIFFVIPILMIVNRYIRVISLQEIVISFAAAFMFRGIFWLFIDQNVRELETNEGISFGGSMIFLLAIAVFSLFTYNSYYGYGLFGRKSLAAKRLGLVGEYYDALSVRLPICSVIFHILLSGGVLLRGLMYINLILVPFLPNLISKYKYSQRVAIKAVLILALILIFYFQTLAVNQLHICPYKFFWE